MKQFASIVLLVVLVGGAPSPLYGYVGPGAGLSAFGALVALVSSILVGIVGFVWYPVKRILRSMKRRRELEEQDVQADLPAK